MQLDEFSLIKKLTGNLPTSSKDIIKGVGDDCAVIRTSKNKYLLATCDALVEDVHFLPKIAKPEQIGQKAVAVNVSDIASMGGKPTFCLVSLIVPPAYSSSESGFAGESRSKKNDSSRQDGYQTVTRQARTINDDYIDDLYSGIIKECGKYNIQIIGGNISSGNQLVVDLFMLGVVKPSQLILRSGAKPGDKVLVTGNMGEAAKGLELLLNPTSSVIPAKAGIQLTIKRTWIPDQVGDDKRRDLIKKQLTPTPRLKESEIIAKSKMVTAMIDISDGLSSDLLHICEQSNVGVRIYEKLLPISKSILSFPRKRESRRRRGSPIRSGMTEGDGLKSVLEQALNGGEDYELLFTAPPLKADEIKKQVEQKTKTKVSIIGEILPQKSGKWLVLKSGKEVPLKPKGWNHLS